MPLSKNLYELEDLCAFFLFSLEHHDVPSAYAVVKELQESLEHDKLESLLVFAWLLTEPSKDFTPQRWSAIINKRYDEFISTFTKNPVFVHPSLRDGVEVEAVVTQPKVSESLPQIVQKSLLHKQVWRAYLQSAHLSKGGATISFLHVLGFPETTLTLLENFGLYLQPRILHHCLYVWAYPDVWSETHLTTPIPSVEITMKTEAILKWGLTPKSTKHLTGAPMFIYEDSPYWVKEREVYGIQPNFVFNSDDLCDQFYAKNFPNDIPDEWAEKERIKRIGSPLKKIPEQVSKHWQTSLSRIICPQSHLIM